MTHPDYADVQPVPDAPLHASTGVVVPKAEVADLAAPEVTDYVVTDDADADDSVDVEDPAAHVPGSDAQKEQEAKDEQHQEEVDSWKEEAPQENTSDASASAGTVPASDNASAQTVAEETPAPAPAEATTAESTTVAGS